MAKVIWFGRHGPLPAQERALKEIYGNDVKIKHVDRAFETEKQFLDFLKREGATAVYAVVALDKIKDMMETETGKSVDWLWAEYADLQDGVRKENEPGFDPERDIAGYFHNIGQHRRFLGFSKIKSYTLETEPLQDITKEAVPESQPSQIDSKTRSAAYTEMWAAVKENSVSYKINDAQKDGMVWINVRFEKDTDMFEHLRPALRDMGFSFNSKYKEWGLLTERENVDAILRNIKRVANETMKNRAIRIMMNKGVENAELEGYKMYRNVMEKANMVYERGKKGYSKDNSHSEKDKGTHTYAKQSTPSNKESSEEEISNFPDNTPDF